MRTNKQKSGFTPTPILPSLRFFRKGPSFIRTSSQDSRLTMRSVGVIKQWQNRCGGFTLIELLVVMAIIGILSGVVLQNITSARIRSRDTARISTIDQINKAIELSATGGTYKLPLTTGYVCLGMTINTSPNSCSPLPDNPINTAVSDLIASNLANKAVPRDPKFQEGIGTAYLYNSNLTPPAGIATGVGAYLSWVAEGSTASSCGRGQMATAPVTNGRQCFLRIGNAVTN